VKYDEPSAGEWITPIRHNYKLACCTCGRVHRLDFRIIQVGTNRRQIQFRVFDDKRATAAVRREMRKREEANERRQHHS
jgi:hypothetical protein